MKQAALKTLQQTARQGTIQLFYLEKQFFVDRRQLSIAGHYETCFTRSRNTPCQRSVIGTLDCGTNMLIHAIYAQSSRFIDDLLAVGDGRLTVIVLDNASICHGIDKATQDLWLIDHKADLLYLPAYSPELNKIEIVWRKLKYRWRRFVI
ncbi:hypothetical protein BHUM_01632c [Candidatus Burkholderia humilis]|nr:hypothetical protein BHUM_01632c [Candidatus Burkholderia humilis]